MAARWPAAARPAPALPVLLAVGAGVALSVSWHTPAVAVTAAICGVAAALSSLRLALLTLAFLVSFDGYITSAVVYRDFLAADVIGATIIVGQLRRGARVPRDHPVVAALSVLALLVALHLLSLSPLNAAEAADNVTRFIYFAALVAAIASASPDIPFRGMAALLMTGVMLRFAYEGVHYFSDASFVLHPSFQFGRMTSNPNTLAGLAACVVPMAASFVLLPGSKIRRVLASIATVSLLGGILLSYSKGAWLTVLAAGALWMWQVTRRRPVHRPSVALALVLAAAAVALVPSARQIPGLIIDRWTSHGSVISNRERVRYLETATALIRQNPVMGVGLERFGVEYMAARGVVRGPDDPHNSYLMIAAELGVPALGCYLFFLAVVFGTGYRQAKAADDYDAPIRAALSGSVAGLIVFQLFSAEPLASRILWLVVALAIAPLREAHHEATASASPVVQRSC